MELDAIAGVSLRTPTQSYELTVEGFGKITLTRPARWNLSDATLRVEPVAEEGAETPSPIVFSVGPWIPQDARVARDNEALEGERELIVQHGLLSHPEQVMAVEFTPAEGLSASAVSALDRLRKRWSSIVDASRDLYRWSPITCEECLRTRRASDGRLGPRGVYSVAGREPCPHTATGSTALRALCEAHGELVFELAQWIVPSTVVQSFGEVIHPPKRFVMHHELMSAMVAQWLLGRSRDAWRLEWLRGYRPNPAAARTHYVRRTHRAVGALDAPTHSAVRFAADAWGLEPEIEPDALFAPRDEDISEHPAPKLRTEADVSERVESARVLPEEPLQRTPRGTEPPPPRTRSLMPPPRAAEAKPAAEEPAPTAAAAPRRGRRKASAPTEIAPVPTPIAAPVPPPSPVAPAAPSAAAPSSAPKRASKPAAAPKRAARARRENPLSETIQDFSAALASLARMTRGK